MAVQDDENPASDNAEPTECDASVDECNAPLPAAEAEAQAAGTDDFDFSPQDELDGSFTPGPLHTPIAEDGLPAHNVESHDQGIAPPFTYETMVCIEDDRAYVEVWDDELCAAVSIKASVGTDSINWYDHAGGLLRASFVDSAGPGVCVRLPRPQYDASGRPNVRREVPADQVVPFFELWLAPSSGDGQLMIVRPKRERCVHYKRQVFADPQYQPGEFGHQVLFRHCTARRSNGGAFMGLRDQAVYMCDYRLPRDPHTESGQDLIDAQKLRDRLHLRLVPMFGAPGEERVLKEDPYAAGIFARPQRR